jgi:hypothetical protein
MRKATRLFLGLALVVGLVVLLSSVWVTAAPPVPATYYGTILVNGANPPLPATVEARIGGVLYASAPAKVSGTNIVYDINVPGDLPETPGKEGGVAGDTVTFHVLGLNCAQTANWLSGMHQLNLTATGTPSVATPTPTRTSTPQVMSTPVTVEIRVSNATIQDTDINAFNKDEVQPGARRNRLHVREDIYNALARYDIAAHVPQNATIQNATLHMYLSYYEHQMTQSPVVSIYQVYQPWDHLQATWNERLTGVPWGGAGCSSPSDRALTPAGSTEVTAVSAWYQWSITSLVQSWATSPAQNYGMALISNNSRELRFYSADDADTRYQPYLRITYTIGGGPTATPIVSATPTKTPSTTATPQHFTKQGALHDTFISSWFVDTNYDATSQRLAVRGNSSMRSLIKFDLSTLPQGATVVSGTLTLTTFEYDDGKPHLPLNIGTYLVNKAWLEWEATWNIAMTGVPWGAPGCNAVPDDRLGVPSSITQAQEVSAPTGPGISYVWNITSIAQAWANNPSAQAGLMLMSVDTSEREIRFVHSEDPRADRWPLVDIYWLPPGPTPTLTPTLTRTPVGGTVSGVVYNDSKGGWANGIRDAGEGGIAGAQVQLWQGATLVREHVTVGSGAFSFEDVTPGGYTLVMTPPSGYLASPGSTFRRDVAVALGMVTEQMFGVYDPLTVRPLGPVGIPLVMKGR